MQDYLLALRARFAQLCSTLGATLSQWLATPNRWLHARMVAWLAVSVLLMCAILATAPQQIPVALYKIGLISVAAWSGYWIDRSLFPYARPDAFAADLALQLSFAAAMLRRALIVSAVMIGVALGA